MDFILVPEILPNMSLLPETLITWKLIQTTDQN